MTLDKKTKLEELIHSASNVGIVAYDAGGANILNALIRRFSGINFFILINGPAKKIFDCSNVIIITDEIFFLNNVDLVLLGTGASSFEKGLLVKAKNHKLLTASILDHFVNYKERFCFNNTLHVPDYCFVCDTYSLDLAKKELRPYNKIYLCENYQITHMKNYISEINKDANAVMYVLENIKENWKKDYLPWEISFNNFYENFFLSSKFDQIIVRPHPKDNPVIYESLKKYKEVVFDFNISPLPSLNKVNTVIGIESYLLYLAHGCGFKVYTSLPKDIREPRLPCFVFEKFGR